MSEIHHKIVQEFLERFREDLNVIGMRIVGSVGRGEERDDSDVDLEVIRDDRDDWQWEKQEKYGIKVDFVISSKSHLEMQFREHPYLCFIDLDKRIIYDPTGFLERHTRRIKTYMDAHPNVLKFWKEEFKLMREAKTRGEKQKGLIPLFDKAEERFSEKRRVTRTYFR